MNDDFTYCPLQCVNTGQKDDPRIECKKGKKCLKAKAQWSFSRKPKQDEKDKAVRVAGRTVEERRDK